MKWMDIQVLIMYLSNRTYLLHTGPGVSYGAYYCRWGLLLHMGPSVAYGAYC